MIGILGLQGDFDAHKGTLTRLGEDSCIVKRPQGLSKVEGLIIPGGESTTLLKLMEEYAFVPALRDFHSGGKPIFGTCAGLILVATEVLNPSQFSLGFIDVKVERNAYGRQRESFRSTGKVNLSSESQEIDMVFIRAPRIISLGDGAESIGTLGCECVMARQKNVLVSSFHPELTDDTRVHRYFLDMI